MSTGDFYLVCDRKVIVIYIYITFTICFDTCGKEGMCTKNIGQTCESRHKVYSILVLVRIISPWDHFRTAGFSKPPSSVVLCYLFHINRMFGWLPMLISQQENHFGLVPTDFLLVRETTQESQGFVRYFPLDKIFLSQQRMSSLTFRHSPRSDDDVWWTGRSSGSS